MENNQQTTNSNKQTRSSPRFWQDRDLDAIAMALGVAYRVQVGFGAPLELEKRLEGWRFVLEADYGAEQVLWALKEFMKSQRDMPVPSDIVRILNPQPPRITEAMYVDACQAFAREGRNAYSAEKQVIDAYMTQHHDAQSEYLCMKREVEALAQLHAPCDLLSK